MEPTPKHDLGRIPVGYLSTPRIYFRGEFRADAATGNNYQAQKFCGTVPISDYCTTDVGVLDVGTARVNILRTAEGRELTDDEMMQVLQANHPRMWNYEGANTISLENAKITGVDLGDGPTSDDALVGANVLMNRAAMVDINPAGILNTQIFNQDSLVYIFLAHPSFRAGAHSDYLSYVNSVILCHFNYSKKWVI